MRTARLRTVFEPFVQRRQISLIFHRRRRYNDYVCCSWTVCFTRPPTAATTSRTRGWINKSVDHTYIFVLELSPSMESLCRLLSAIRSSKPRGHAKRRCHAFRQHLRRRLAGSLLHCNVSTHRFPPACQTLTRASLYGVMCCQCYSFFQSSYRDSRILRYSVRTVVLMKESEHV